MSWVLYHALSNCHCLYFLLTICSKVKSFLQMLWPWWCVEVWSVVLYCNVKYGLQRPDYPRDQRIHMHTTKWQYVTLFPSYFWLVDKHANSLKLGRIEIGRTSSLQYTTKEEKKVERGVRLRWLGIKGSMVLRAGQLELRASRCNIISNNSGLSIGNIYQ